MKTRLTAFLLLLTMMIAAPQAAALEIRILSNGRIEFYTGSVLGDDDGEEKEDKREEHKQESRIRTINSDDQELRVRSKEDRFEIELKDKSDSQNDDHDFEKVERMETDDVRVKFPARLSDDHDESEKEERVELKSKIKNKKQVLELKSRNVRAALKNGAEFGLDPVTNQVTITTPSGQEHTLEHLPDQAIEKMRAGAFFSGNSDGVETEIEVETDENGELIYKKKDKIKKRLFGIFSRQVDSEIILNDTTGEVVEHEVNSSSIFEQFLNRVSF